MNSQGQSNKLNGFTVMDMLVAFGIVVMLSGILAANFKSFQTSSEIKSEAERLSATIRQAQLWALSGQTRGGVRPSGGWGVHLEECAAGNCRYFIYADLWPALTPNYRYDVGSDEIISEVLIDPSVDVSNLNPNSSSQLDVNFVSPDATGYINGSQTASQAVVEFTQAQSGKRQSVTVYRATKLVELSELIIPPQPQCHCGVWTTGACGAGSCNPDGQRQQTRICDPVGCSFEVQCVPDASCVPPPPPSFVDTFTESSDQELSQHTPDIGSGWTKILEVGSATLIADSADYMQPGVCSGNEGALYRTIDIIDSADYEVSVRYEQDSSNDNYSHIAARIQNNGDMYLFQFSRDRGELYRRVNGSWTQLGSDTAGFSDNNGGDIIILRAQGSVISVLEIDAGSGTTITHLSVTDTSISAPGSAGIGLGKMDVPGWSSADCSDQRLDDFIVQILLTTQCNDNLDNDSDGWVDLADAGCIDAQDTLESGGTTTFCSDGLDNDGDGFIDSADPGCSDGLDTSELGLLACDNGLDDDSDGLADSADPGCIGPADNDELGDLACDNGLDDDNDGLTDKAQDPGCQDAFDTSELGGLQCDNGIDDDSDGVIDLSDPGCIGPSDNEELSQCGNFLDDDIDSLIDYPADLGCYDLSDDDEVDPPPGPVFQDTFTESFNRELSQHTPDIGSGWTKILDVGNVTLRADSSDYLRRDSCGSSDGALYRTNDIISSADYEVSVRYANADSNDDYSHIAARIQDQNNLYLFQFSSDRGELYRRLAGNWTQLGSDTVGFSTNDTVALRVIGDSISVWRNGGILLSQTDASHSSPGYAGVGLGKMGVPGWSGADCSDQRLDDFEVSLQ